MILSSKSYIMRFISYFHNDNEISIHNSLLGVESIQYNGEKMASKFSVLGTSHTFSVYEDDEEVDYRVETSYGTWGLIFSIWRNEKPLILSPMNRRKLMRTPKYSEFV